MSVNSAASGRWTGSVTAMGRGLVLTGLALWEAVLLLWLSLCVTLISVGIGVVMLPSAMRTVRREADQQRHLADAWSGVMVSRGYASDIEGEPGLVQSWRKIIRSLSDGATRTDLVWLLVNPFVAPFLAFLPALAVIHGVWGVVLLAMWRPVIQHWDNSWYLFVPLRNEWTAVLSAVLGLVEIVLGFAIAGPLLHQHGRWVRYMLGRPSWAALNTRMQTLTESRSTTVNDQASELRRIERDLHDGAQSRLVAMGMTIAAAERVLDDNPAAARGLLAEAKDSSAQALKELRELVRGIHPPVLADRGLIDAIRARALDCAVPVEVRASLSGRVPPPVESSVYFAVSELLTNISKHAKASKAIVTIDHVPPYLRVEVQDDGVGGADVSQGTGLEGVERRIAAFDGTLRIESPQGGPTVLCMEIPCDIVAAPVQEHV